METTKKRGFAYGYILQIDVLLMFFLFAALTNDLFNVFPSMLSEMYGWDYSATLSVATYAGYAGVVGTFIGSAIVQKKGNRFGAAQSMILCGVFAALFVRFPSLPAYLVLCCFMFFFAFQFGTVLTGTVTAAWFPRKRGVILGFTSAGMCLSSCISPQIFVRLLNYMSLANAVTVFAVVTIAVGVISIFWIKEHPEDIGLVPDGDDSNLEDLKKTQEKLDKYKSPWTVGKLLKTPSVWTQAIGYGVLFMATLGILGQWVPRAMEQGYTQAAALNQLSVAALCGIGFSILWGVVDFKLGTKKTSIIFCIWHIVATTILLLGVHSIVLTWIGIIMVGSTVGGIGNLGPSMIIRTFGRLDTPSATKVIQTITNILRVSAFAVVALGLNIFGGFVPTYYIFIICGVVGLIMICLTKDKMIGTKDEEIEML